MGSTLAACGGGPQGYAPGLSTPAPVVSATTPSSGPTALTTTTPSPAASGATATPTPLASGATASPAPGSSATAAPSTPTPAATLAPTATPVATATPIATATPAPAATPTVLPAGEKIYVVNHGLLGDDPSVTIYPAAATGNQAPLATIAGSNTKLGQPFDDVVDATGTLYVSNQSNTPGTQTSGYVTEYAATDQSGNVVPTNTITGLHNPEGLAIDAGGNLYVAVVDEILEFAPGATGNATPIRTIAGAATTLQNLVLGGQPAGLALDAAGNIYTSMGAVILEFSATAVGNVAPTAVFGGVNGSNMATTGPPYGSPTLASSLGLAVDPTGNLYAANFNNSSFALFPTTTGDAAGVSIESTSASMPFGVSIDTASVVYVANYGNNSVIEFSSMATFATGVATTTISGAATGLDHPYGVTAR